jgi:hypothetical protein
MADQASSCPTAASGQSIAAGPVGFTLFSYMYRDASNYKQHGEISFLGTITEDEEARLEAALDEGEYFIATQVRVPEVFFEYGEDSAEDHHCWHEYSGVEPAMAATDPFNRTISQFIDEVVTASVAGWQEFEQKLGALV